MVGELQCEGVGRVVIEPVRIRTGILVELQDSAQMNSCPLISGMSRAKRSSKLHRD